MPRVQLRRYTAAQWASDNPTLLDGEVGYIKDTGQLKVGDGATAWNALAAYAPVSNYQGYRTPKSTQWALPSNMQSGAAISLTAALSGVVSFVPLEIGKSWPALNALGVNLSAAAVSTGTVAVSLGAYPDGGDGAGPLCTGGPIRSGSFTPTTSTGNRVVSFANWVPPAGLYWLACLYIESGTAPTTRASVYAINGSLNGPINSGNAIGATVGKGWSLGGQTALPTTDIRSSLTVNGGNAVVVAAQAA